MRWACAILLLLVPAGLAQTLVMEDGENDAVASVAGGVGAPDATVETGPYDLRAFFVDESPDGFVFSVQVRDLALDSTSFGNGAIHAQFQHADRVFRISWFRSEGFGVSYNGEFSAYDGGRGGWDRLERGPVDVDAAANMLHFQTARDRLLDGNGTAPQAGRSLERFQAFSRGTSQPFAFSGAALQIADTMPDQGFGTPYAVLLGLAQSGHAALSSDDPVRSSNGEKATFVYQVQATNLAPEEDRFTLSVRNVPPDWDVTLPAASIRLDANITRSFPLLVGVPFEHVHGAFKEFILEMTSQSDARSVGRLQLGIRYLATPQPAGHHDMLWLHSRTDADEGNTPLGPFGGGAAAYMNTLEEDELDEGIAVPAQEGGSALGGSRWAWEIYLEPGLEMGLDFDRNGTGEIEVRFDAASQMGIDAAELRGQLLHMAGERAPDGTLWGARTTVLADLVPSSPVSIGADTALTATIQPTPESDFVLYQRDAALVLRLELDGEGTNVGFTADDLPRVLGGWLRLPLNEYRDPVQGVFNALAGLSFHHESQAERLVNPGKTVLFNLTLTNDGAVDDTFSLRANGTNAAWARVLGDTRVFVPTGSQRQVVVAVQPPTDAPEGDVVDIIVTAASQAEPTIQGNIRVLAIVDTVLEHPDESHLVSDLEKSLSKGKNSPVGWVALPLFGAVLARRRG